MRAPVHSFESLAALDGEGLRCAVFFCGCPLRCAYCHNPDTWCGGGVLTESGALAGKIRRLKPYFNRGGGVTFSGGEPLLHAAFILETAALLQADGIRYTLDTSGSVPLCDDVRRAVEGAELILLDIKFPDRASYARYTGGDFDTFLTFADFVSAAGKRVWYRTVIVPGLNDSERALDAYARLVARWNRPARYELLGFHTMGFFKYAQSGIANPLAGTDAMDPERLRSLQTYLNQILRVT